MSDQEGLVDYQEAISIQVGKFLLSKGFDLAQSNGFALYLLNETDSLGILRKDTEAKPRKYLLGLIKRKPSRRWFLGTVWFKNKARNASEQNWVFEMYGRTNVELAKQLAEELASTFNVKIALRLVRDQPKVELREFD